MSPLLPLRRAFFVACVLSLFLSSASAFAAENAAAAAPAGQRVFYTGHSFHMFVPPRVEQLVKAAEIKNHKLVDTQSIGGSRVYQHWNLEDGKNKAKPALMTGEIDVFTMAAHLTVPDDGITNFTELGLKHNPKLRLLVQESWYPFDTSDPEKRIKNNAERNDSKIEDLQAAMDEWRTRLEAQADELNKLHGRKAVFIVPVGEAVVKLRKMVIDGEYPGVKTQSELFTDPIGHAGMHVQWLCAYCNFVAIYRINPEGLQVTQPGVSAEHHAILQKLAWETVSKYPYAGVAKTEE